MQLSSEFLVVGAGAAGSALGWLMRQAGHDVLVVELHDAQTKEKLCGGLLSPESLSELKTIYGPEALSELDLTYPPQVRLRSSHREIALPAQCATIERKRLDDWLLAQYLLAGGDLRDCVRLVQVDEAQHVATCVDQRTGERLEISYGTLIGADGAASTVRRLSTSRHQKVVASLEGFAPLLTEDLIIAHELGHQGYCWYIPTGQVANVGCVTYTEDAHACREWLASFCESLGIAVPALTGAPIPSGDDVLLKAGTDIWLIGDAAGLISPINSGGISFALSSARLLVASFTGGTSYEEALRPTIKVLTELAEQRGRRYFLTNMRILQKGLPFHNKRHDS